MEVSPAAQDLSKLTVPQLKALCKERKITGYSKLSKPALLQKLASSQSPDGLSAPLPNSAQPHVLPQINNQDASPVPISSSRASAIHSSNPMSPTKSTLKTRTQRSKLKEAVGLKPLSSSQIAPLISASPDTAHIPNPTEQNRSSDSLVPSSRSPPDGLEDPQQRLASPQSSLDGPSGTFGSNKTGLSSIDGRAPNDRMHTSSPTARLTLDQPTLHVPSPISSPSFRSASSKRSLTPSALPSSVDVTSKRRKTVSSIIFHRNQASAQPAQGFTSRSLFPLPNDSNMFTVPALPSRLLTQASVSSISGSVTSDNAQVSTHPKSVKDRHMAIVFTSRRFKPLVVKKYVPFALTVSSPKISGSSTTQAHLVKDNSSSRVPVLQYLDLSCSPPVSLVPITLPPKVSQRKRVPRWAIILSGLLPEERRQCILVSRMFRYAVYLSSAHLLTRDHDGLRLAYIQQKYPQNMTNMWPYLKQRNYELSMLKKAYSGSFLVNFFRAANPICERLWTSPDHEKQTVIALRFSITKLWFALSVCGGEQDPMVFMRGVVIDAQEIVKSEIWSVTVQYPSQMSGEQEKCESFYVLESTCEVVGRLPGLRNGSVRLSNSDFPSDSIPIRADWSAYIAHRLLPLSVHDAPPLPLSAYLSWQNHEEFDKGISKVWLKRITREGEFGAAKRVVAERYVLACVVGNSVSGRWMSSSQMEQDFAGLPIQSSIAKIKSPKVHLFLPAHHHVESVHFTTSSGIPFHPAVAVVQTPGREYYILKDNGMQIGCEEDGVASVWMELLKCTPLGLL